MDIENEMISLTEDEWQRLFELLGKISSRDDWESVLKDDEEKIRECIRFISYWSYFDVNEKSGHMTNLIICPLNF